MSRCHACGHEGCPAQADPVGGGYPLHNAMAYARLLETRAREAQVQASRAQAVQDGTVDDAVAGLS